MSSSVRILISGQNPPSPLIEGFISSLPLEQKSYLFNAALVSGITDLNDDLMLKIDQYLENSLYEMGILFCSESQSAFFLKNRWRVFSNPYIQTDEFIMIKLLPLFPYLFLNDLLSQSIEIPEHENAVKKSPHFKIVEGLKK